MKALSLPTKKGKRLEKMTARPHHPFHLRLLSLEGNVLFIFAQSCISIGKSMSTLRFPTAEQRVRRSGQPINASARSRFSSRTMVGRADGSPASNLELKFLFLFSDLKVWVHNNMVFTLEVVPLARYDRFFVLRVILHYRRNITTLNVVNTARL